MVVVVLIDEFTYLHTKIKDGTISGDFMKFWRASCRTTACSP